MLRIETTQEAGRVAWKLSGRLDTGTAPQLTDAWESIQASAQELTVDCDALEYVSSAGLRVLLTIQKKMQDHVRYTQVDKSIIEVFELTGFSEILHYTPKRRSISVAGCEKIAEGGNGEVFRIDEETILKLYRENVDETVVEKEKAAARAALVVGLPTAISYEIVQCGARRGVLYELLRADTLSAKILAEPDRLEENVRLFADLCKQIHTTQGDASLFPKTEEVVADCIRTIDCFTPGQRQGLLERVLGEPNPGTYVHGDLHTSNIMMQDGEPCLIDMVDFSIGSPWFDLGQIYLIYVKLAESGSCRRAVGMEPELSLKVWDLFVDDYFGPDTDREALVKKLKPYLLYRCVVASELRGWKKPREYFQAQLRDAFPELAEA